MSMTKIVRCGVCGLLVVSLLGRLLVEPSCGAEREFASHPPARPLPAPTTRPLGTGPAYFVDPVRGDDQSAGTQNAPWKTLGHSAAQLKPGDTLYLRGGTYFEHAVITCSGTAQRPITLRAYPGELPIVNGGLREFYEQPQTAWEPCPEGVAGEYRSCRSFPGLGSSAGGMNVMGRFGDSFLPLLGYRFLADLRDPSMVWDVSDKVGDTEGVYCGPGVFYDTTTGRIHIRPAHTNLKSLGDDNYRGETDPRKMPLVIAGFGDGPALALRGARHVRVEDLVVCGAATSTMEIADCADVTCDGLTVFGGRSAVDVSGTARLRMVHTACRGAAAPWTFRGHLKYRSTEARIFTASGWTPRTSENRDFELAYCEFTDSVDGVFIGNVKHVHFHHNLVDNVSDDGIFLTAGTAYDGTTHGGDHYIYQNLLSRCLTTFAFGVGHGRQKMTAHGRQAGFGAWIYRNVFDLRRPVHYQLPKPEDDYLTSYGRVASDHGGPTWEPMNIYHNTIVEHTPAGREYYLCDLAGHMQGGSSRRLFNNLAVQTAGIPGRRLPAIVLPPDHPEAPAPTPPNKPADDPLASLLDDPLRGKSKPSTIAANLDPKDLKKLEATLAMKPAAALPFHLEADGNLHWSGNLKAEQMNLFAGFRDSPEWERSKHWYAAGWASHDVVADPQFVRCDADWRNPLDLRLASTSPAVDAGVVPADQWPDPLRSLDRGRPDMGALPAGVEPWRVGVRGRLTMFGSSSSTSEVPALAPIAFPPASEIVRPNYPPAALVQGYPPADGEFVRFALAKHGVPLELCDRVWLDTANYPRYRLVVIVGNLTRAGMSPDRYSPADLQNVEQYLNEGGTLLLMRQGREAFFTKPGRFALNRWMGSSPPPTDAELQIRLADHPWLKHLNPNEPHPWTAARSAAPLTAGRGEAIIATADDSSATLIRIPVGKGQLVYLGWELGEFFRREEEPSTVDDERAFEEQLQLLENIITDVYAISPLRR